MLLIRALALAALVLAAPILASAQDKAEGPASEPPVVGVVDVQRVIREAAAAIHIRDALNAAKEQMEDGLRQEGEALKGEEEQLRKQQTILAPEAFQAKRRDLEQRYADLRRRVQDSSTRLGQARDEAFNAVRAEMYKVLTAVMEKHHITMTFARKSVLVYDERMNITDEVLQELNSRLPKVDVVVPAHGQ